MSMLNLNKLNQSRRLFVQKVFVTLCRDVVFDNGSPIGVKCDRKTFEEFLRQTKAHRPDHLLRFFDNICIYKGEGVRFIPTSYLDYIFDMASGIKNEK